MPKFITPDENDLMIGIKRVSNGFLVQQTNEVDEKGKVLIEETVFETDPYGKDADLGTMLNLLYHIKDFLGCHYNKHASKNVDISIKTEEG